MVHGWNRPRGTLSGRCGKKGYPPLMNILIVLKFELDASN